MAGLGTQTAALAAQGATVGGSGDETETEAYEFDGSSWASANDASNKKKIFRNRIWNTDCGSNVIGSSPTDGGSNLTHPEEYDGTNFSTGGTMNTGRRNLASAGILTAGIAYGNNPPPGSSASETYDGTNWTTGPSLNTGVFAGGGTGAANSAALGMGGYISWSS